MRSIIIAILSLHLSDAFTSHSTQSIYNNQAQHILFARSICTFDEDDFALKQGEWPYTAADLNRLDNTVDTVFYDEPRFVTHIDDGAISALNKFYAQEFSAMNKDSLDVLDLCSSWIR